MLTLAKCVNLLSVKVVHFIALSKTKAKLIPQNRLIHLSTTNDHLKNVDSIPEVDDQIILFSVFEVRLIGKRSTTLIEFRIVEIIFVQFNVVH